MSVGGGIVEHVFDGGLPEVGGLGALSAAELVDAASGWARSENAACARKLAVMAEIFARRTGLAAGERELWWIDPEAAVAAELAAAQNITASMALHQTHRGVALRDRLPKIAALFEAGLIGDMLVRAIVWRTYLIADDAAMAAVDGELAAEITGWGALSVVKTEERIDALVDRHDPGALRRSRESRGSRDVAISSHGQVPGHSSLWALLYAGDAALAFERVQDMAYSVCDRDPRSVGDRRADAMTALMTGIAFGCRCGAQECEAAGPGPAKNTTVFVIADQDTLTEATQESGAQSAVPDEPSEPDEPDGPDEPEAPEEPRRNRRAPTRRTSPMRRASEAGGAGRARRARCAGRRRRPRRAEDGEGDGGGCGGPGPMSRRRPCAPVPPQEVSSQPIPERAAPAHVFGAGIMPTPLLKGLLDRARFRTVSHPGLAPAEPRYTPSRALADFVRCRDLTCRFPGCNKPATDTDLDHTVPWPLGPTHASNIKCLCRFHHLLKTFWTGDSGWQDQQLPDGTVIWTSPTGHTYTTHPGSRLLYPTLCEPTGDLWNGDPPTPAETSSDRGAKMPRRRHTRAHNRTRAITAERHLNDDHVIEQTRPPPF